MVRLLLDTHVALFALVGDSRLKEGARALLEDEGNEVYFSSASVWEIAIKHAKRPDELPMPPQDFFALCQSAGCYELPVLSKHSLLLSTLLRDASAPIHKDPFDRLLICQAKSEHMLLVTQDALLPAYNEACVLCF